MMLPAPFNHSVLLHRWMVFASILLPLTATAQLRLVCEINDTVYPLASVEGDHLMLEKEGQTFRAPKDAVWRLEGDLRQQTELVSWSPWYSIRRVIDAELEVAPDKPFQCDLLFSNPFNREEEKDADPAVKDWPDGLPKGGAAIVVWLVDGKVTDMEVVALQATGKGSRRNFGARFRLTSDTVRGQPAVLLWGGGDLIAPNPLFEDASIQRALVAALLDDKQSLANMPAIQHPEALSREQTPLINYVAEAGAANALGLLLEKDRRAARLSDDDGVTPLHLAARMGRERTVEILLEAGAVANAKTELGETALSEAIESGCLPVVHLLLEARALPANRTHRSTLLNRAISSGFADLAQILTDAGAKYDSRSDAAATTLIDQAREGHWEMVQWLIKNGVSADESRAGQTALLAAARSANRRLAEVLLTAGADPNKSNPQGFSPLMAAANNGNTGFAAALLEAGADANAQSESGATVLQIAAYNNATAIVSMLLDAGAELNARNNQGLSALDAALLNGAGDAARELAGRGATIDLGSSYSQTLLEAALRWDIPEPLDAALQAGWPANSTFAGVWPALRLAQVFDATRCEALLAAAGAEAQPDQPTPMVSANALDERPKITRAVLPEDPRPTTEWSPEAAVRVEFILDSEGRPLFPKVSDSPDQRLGPAALAVISQWRFTRPRSDGRAVSTKVLLPISFPASEERVFELDELSERPMPVSRVAPVYPFALKQGQIEGSVALLFVVRPDGSVSDVEVESSSDPRFSAAVVDALYRWRFTPGKFAGRPVATKVRQIVRFQHR